MLAALMRHHDAPKTPADRRAMNAG